MSFCGIYSAWCSLTCLCFVSDITLEEKVWTVISDISSVPWSLPFLSIRPYYAWVVPFVKLPCCWILFFFLSLCSPFLIWSFLLRFPQNFFLSQIRSVDYPSKIFISVTVFSVTSISFVCSGFQPLLHCLSILNMLSTSSARSFNLLIMIAWNAHAVYYNIPIIFGYDGLLCSSNFWCVL